MRRFVPLLAAAVLVFADRRVALASTSAQVLAVGNVVAHRIGHTATALTDGRVLVTGGRNEAGALASTEIFDPTSGTFAPGAPLASPRVAHTATRLPDGRVLIAGGTDGGGAALETAELFDPSTGQVTALPDMGSARSGHSATALPGGLVLLVGGDPDGTAEVFDADGMAFVTLSGTLVGARAGHAASLLADGTVLIAGGVDAAGVAFDSVELFDPSTQGFAALPYPMFSARAGVAEVVVGGDVILVGGDASGTLELFHASDRSFTALALTLGGPDATATRLANEHVLVVGRDGAALFDPATSAFDTFAEGASLAREGHSATLTAEGKVLVGFGHDAAGAYRGRRQPLQPGLDLDRRRRLLARRAGVHRGRRVPAERAGGDARGAQRRPAHRGRPGGALAGDCRRERSRQHDVAGLHRGLHRSRAPGLCAGAGVRARRAHALHRRQRVRQRQSMRRRQSLHGRRLRRSGRQQGLPAHDRQRRGGVSRGGGRVRRRRDLQRHERTCPADVKKASGTSCSDEGNACTVDQCNGGSNLCQHTAGNAGAVCRAAGGECDVQETCTGSSTACPADAKKASGVSCGDDGNACSTDQCNGTLNACQHPAGNAGGGLSRGGGRVRSGRHVQWHLHELPRHEAAERHGLYRRRQRVYGRPVQRQRERLPASRGQRGHRLPRRRRRVRRRGGVQRHQRCLPGGRQEDDRLPRGGRRVRRRGELQR
jgi:hypothetical protein